jgi:hypothetical protein
MHGFQIRQHQQPGDAVSAGEPVRLPRWGLEDVAVGRLIIDDEDNCRIMPGEVSSEVHADHHTYSLTLARSWRGLKGFAT